MSDSRVLKNSLSSTALFLSNLAITFLMAPIYVKFLGATGYGAWELMLALIGYLGILDIGVSPALVQIFSSARSRDDLPALHKTFQSGLFLLSLVGAIGTGVLLLASAFPEHLIGKGVDQVPHASAALALFAVNFFITWVRTPFSCYLMGHQEHYILYATRIVSGLCEAAIVWYLFTNVSGVGLLAVTAVGACSALVQFVIFYARVRYIDRGLRVRAHLDRQIVKGIASFGVKSAMLAGSFTIFNGGILFLIAKAISVTSVLTFVFPQRLTEYAASLMYSMSTPLEPYFAAVASEGGESLRRSWSVTQRATQFVGFAVALACIWLGVPFLSVWMGADYGASTTVVFYIFCVGLVVQIFCSVSNRVLIGTGNHGRVAIYSTVVALLALGAGVPLVGKWGVAGAAAARTLFVSLSFTRSYGHACKLLKISVMRELVEAVITFILPILLGSAGYFASTQLLPPVSYPALFVAGIVGSSLYLGTAWFTALSGAERQMIVSFVRRRATAA